MKFPIGGLARKFEAQVVRFSEKPICLESAGLNWSFDSRIKTDKICEGFNQRMTARAVIDTKVSCGVYPALN